MSQVASSPLPTKVRRSAVFLLGVTIASTTAAASVPSSQYDTFQAFAETTQSTNAPISTANLQQGVGFFYFHFILLLI